jgi:plasmid rolling circle replication initiator protein Rep
LTGIKKGIKVVSANNTTKPLFFTPYRYSGKRKRFMDNSTTVDSEFKKYLSDYSKKDEKWDIQKSANQNVEAIFKNSDEDFHIKQAGRLSQCSGFLVFVWEKDIATGEIRLKLKQVRFCHVRLCPICQWRRSMAWQYRMFTAMPKLSEQFPTHRWLMLTLTVRNCEVSELKTTIRHMQQSFKRLRERKDFPAHGYIKSLEVTRSENGEAHPHFHVLLMVPRSYFQGYSYIKTERWAELWQESLRVDYLPVVDVRTVKSKNPNKPHDISAAVVEVLKYETKVADLEAHPDFLLELAKQLVRVRAVEVGGVLKQYLKTDEPDSDEELIGHQSDEEKLDELQAALTFNWQRSIKRYVKK